MSDSEAANKEKQLSPLKRALVAINDLQVKLENLENKKREPIAVIGMGCKFPHAEGPEEFWQMLNNGIDGIVEVPKNRWDVDQFYDPESSKTGKMITRNGGFMSGVDRFDAQFFGISPREAERMDPQQRLLLRVIWEAFENAGIIPDSIKGSKTGVFVGISSNDYSLLQQGDITKVDAYSGTGNAFSIAANRISYTFDLQGPSVAVDTACSSSLVATHLAMRSLRNEESDIAVAGGVNLILSPELTIAFSQAGMMAPDGRCKTFDSSADGYGRGEGCGAVILKRLSDAIHDGDNIHAVLLGSAINQDGRSNGLTAPNGLSQQEVIRAALIDARLAANDLDYLEAHGTGTILGDPIEMRSIDAVMDGRSLDDPLIVGSVKTNIGHLEAAAGIAGLIKVILSMENGKIPPHLHFNEINPYITIDEMPIEIPVGGKSWNSSTKIRYAGVSSFGFGGTNSHIILASPDYAADPSKKDAGELDKESGFSRPEHILTLSAKHEISLQKLIDLYSTYIHNIQISRSFNNISLADICHTANTSRASHELRLAIPARSLEELQSRLVESSSIENILEFPGEGIYAGENYNKKRPKIAFLFTGQGAQYPEMGRYLYQTQPTFKNSVDRCLEILENEDIDAPLEVPLRILLIGDENMGDKSDSKELINETAYTQMALFVIEYALAELWFSWDIKPDYLLGHSVGEYVAACIAEVFSLEDGLKLIAARGRLMQSLPEGGEMAAVFATVDQVSKFIKPDNPQISIATVNGPSNVVISGDGTVLQSVVEEIKTAGYTVRKLKVSHAFHSSLMDPILGSFLEIAEKIQYHPPKIFIASNLTGGILDKDTIPDADYWARHIRNPVQFNDGMQTLAEAGIKIFIETGPNPTLTGMGKRCLPDYDAVWLPSLKKNQDDWKIISGSLSSLYVSGYSVNWSSVDRDYSAWMKRDPSGLPNYAFNNERYWFDMQGKSLSHDQRARLEGVLSNDDADEPEWTEEELTSIILKLSENLSDLTKTRLLHQLNEKFGAPVELQESIQLDRSQQDQIVTLDQINSAEPKHRHGLIVTLIRSELARVLKMRPERLEVNKPINYMGLDSIMAIELRNRFEKILSLDIPISNLLQDLSIEQLAVQLSGVLSARDIAQQGRVTPEIGLDGAGDGAGLFPLSHGQKAMWVQHMVAPLSIQNPVYAVRVNSEFNAETLARILKALINWHPSLRTTFELRDNEPVQIVHDDLELFFRHVDISEMSREEVQKFMNDEAGRAYNLETGPLFRVYLLTRSERDHILLFAAHHIVIDLWSMAIVLNQLTVLYRAVTNAGAEIESLQSPVKFKYTDYVRWQTDMLESPEGERYWDYWKGKLDGDLPVLELPTDHPRPAIQTFKGASKSYMLDQSLTKDLQRLAEDNGSTLYQVLMTAFNIFLYRYTGQRDIIVGSPMIGRGHPEFTGIVGYFVNPVPIRSTINSNNNFIEFLQAVRLNVLDAIARQNYPFNLLVEKLAPERDPSHLPIFQVMFVYQKTHPEYDDRLSKFALDIEGLKMNVAGLELETVRLDQRSAPFELTLMMAEADDTIGTTITYNTDLFETDTIERFWLQFKTLLENIVAHQHVSISELTILSDADRHRLLLEMNQTRTRFPSELCIHELFEEQVRRSPDSVAVSFEKQFLTYEQLNKKSNRLANYLKVLGIGPEVVVGICLERSVETIVSILAVLKAGGAYLPIDPVYPSERISFMVEDAHIPVLITHSGLKENLKQIDSKMCFIDLDCEQQVRNITGKLGSLDIDQESIEDNLKIDVVPSNLAYVIYTSGSTGQSKGVMLRHSGLNNLVNAQTRGFNVSRNSRVLQFASLSFDASVSEIFMALLTGARLVLAKRETMISAPALEELIVQNEITTITLPPSLLSLLPADKLPNLKTVVSAGESCPPEIAEKWGAGRNFFNAYGPTECTIGPTYFRYIYKGEKPKKKGSVPPIRKDKDARPVSIPIGRPIDNTQVYLLDEDNQPVPFGASGEICIAGVGLARGYMEQPAMTASKFIPNPFTEVNGDRLYRTGDLGRFLPDGNIEFIGRTDYQVKVRGFRIELGEVETILSTHADVGQAVVIAQGKNQSDRKLIAYVVPKNGETLSTDILRSQIKKHLPDYMIPSVFKIMETLPLTTSGKVDRKQLPEVDLDNADREIVYVPPQTELERSIALIWQEVLGIKSVGLDDNFFDLGGHSLSMTKAHIRLQEILQRDFSIVEMFSHPTIRSFSDYLNKESQDFARVKVSYGRANKQKDALQRQRSRLRNLSQERRASSLRRRPVRKSDVTKSTSSRASEVLNTPDQEDGMQEIPSEENSEK